MTVACELAANAARSAAGSISRNVRRVFEISQSARKLADRAAAGYQHRQVPGYRRQLYRA